ncbi:MAG: alpha/beta hydrolase, partial [Nitratireductor sp.]|nr:alpha/beta hydrolase [Nitratireductor sp.]
NVYTRELFEDGRRNLVLTGEVVTHCPVHILQGRLDPDVPWTHAMTLANQLIHESVSMTLVPDGDHRLSRPQDIELMLSTLGRLIEGE